MDMCGRLCMPRWFVGMAEVTCDDVEEVPYHNMPTPRADVIIMDRVANSQPASVRGIP